MANFAALRNSVVVCIAPTVQDFPAGLVYDTSRDATGANIGDTWNGSAYVSPPVPVEQANEQTLRQQATQAFLDNRAFLNLASPSNAQTLAQVKALTRQMNKVMRLVLSEFDGTD